MDGSINFISLMYLEPAKARTVTNKICRNYRNASPMMEIRISTNYSSEHAHVNTSKEVTSIDVSLVYPPVPCTRVEGT